MMNLLRVRPVVAISALTVLGSLLTWSLVALTPREGHLFQLFFERGWIQCATTVGFWLTVAMLIRKHSEATSEEEALRAGRRILESPEFSGTLIWSSAEMVRQRFVSNEEEAYHQSVTFTRIANAMDRLRKTQNTQEMADYFRTRSDIDSVSLETGYAGIRYFLWLIPTLGFIGTVIGIGLGISGFATIIQNARDFQAVQTYLPQVTQSLGSAFDTTLLALAYSVAAVFYMSILHRRQEQLLQDLDHLCFDTVCALFEDHTGSSDELVQALNELGDLLLRGVHGDRATIVSVLREELPAQLANLLADSLASTFHGFSQRLETALKEDRATIARKLDELSNRAPSARRTLRDS